MGEVIAFPNEPFPGRLSAPPAGVLAMLRRLVQARRYAQLAATLDDKAARSALLERARQLVNEAGTMGRLIRAKRSR